MIKEFFSNYSLHMSDVTFDMSKGSDCKVHQNHSEPWRVTLVDTGEKTMTGGRIRRIAPFLEGDDTFLPTYGDGVGNVDIQKLLAYHYSHDAKATLTVVRPPARFGALDIAVDGSVKKFQEKTIGDNAYINGGYFVLSRGVIDYIQDDATIWERGPLETLAAEGNLKAFRHNGFWQPMDTLRDKEQFDGLWEKGNAPWKVWA
jgi:glucose-1-phosphate cytidylyltransferase